MSLKTYHVIRDLKGMKKPAMWLCGIQMFQLERTGKEASVTVYSEPGGEINDDTEEVARS